jgi:hypothetical protein
MPKQKLNLLELAACLVAKPRARSPEIVRSDAEETAFRRCFSYNSPMTLGLNSLGAILPALLMARKIGPP